MDKSVLTIPLGILMVVLALAAAVPTIEPAARLGLIAIVAVVTLWNTLYTVDQQEAAVLTMFGKFVGVGNAGLNFKIPFLVNLKTRNFSLQVRQEVVPVSTFTGNNMPVEVEVAVQYYVDGSANDVREAYFRLADPRKQIVSYVETAVRNRIPSYQKLDELLVQQKTIAEEVQTDIGEQMKMFGYMIKTTLLTKVAPTAKVLAAMAAVAEAEYRQKAAEADGEAFRIREEKEGQGMGDKRAAVMERVAMSLEKFKLDALDPAERTRVYDLIELSIKADALEKMATTSGAKVIFTPGMSLDSMSGGIAAQVRQAMLESGEAGRPA